MTSPKTGTHDVAGDIRQRWIDLGGVDFGLPTTDSTLFDPAGNRQFDTVHFQTYSIDGPHDSAIGTSSAGTFFVTGEIFTAWYSSGSSWGVPTSDEEGITLPEGSLFGSPSSNISRFQTFASDGGHTWIINWESHPPVGGTHFTADYGYGPQQLDFTPRSGPTGFEPVVHHHSTSAPLTVSTTYQILPGAIDRNVLDLISSIQSPNSVAAPIPLSADSIWVDSDLWSGAPVTDYTPFVGFDALPADFDIYAIESMPIDPVAVARSAQTISINAIADGTYGDAPITLNATADSGLAVSYQVLSGPATITDNVLTITGAGAVTIEATQAGDDVFDAAMPIDLSFTVNKAQLTVAADNQTRVFGQANPAFTATITGFVNGETLDNSGITGEADFSTTATASSSVGTYAINASLGSLTADNYDFTNFMSGSLKVTKAGT